MNVLSRMSICVEEKLATLKEMANYLFGNLPEVKLFTLKFQLLDYVIEDVNKIGRLR